MLRVEYEPTDYNNAAKFRVHYTQPGFERRVDFYPLTSGQLLELARGAVRAYNDCRGLNPYVELRDNSVCYDHDALDSLANVSKVQKRLGEALKRLYRVQGVLMALCENSSGNRTTHRASSILDIAIQWLEGDRDEMDEG